jgi:hypothetical protein
MRAVIAAVLFAAAVVSVVVSPPNETAAQDKKDEKKTQPKADSKSFKPDEATLKQIKDKTDELRKAVAALKEKKIEDGVLVEVEIYLKAAENIVRFEEWLAANSVKWALTTLDQGLARAKQAEGGKAVWRDAPGKWVLRAYRSSIDDSIQPYAALLPPDYGKDPKKEWRLDVVLHGRDSALTEAKFIATHQGTAPKELDFIQLEVYGRGNNAYRWAGETDVFEAISAVGYKLTGAKFGGSILDPNRMILRGFSMGGAGTWHIGLHHPADFCVIGPGAGFTTTHGYIAGLPKELPEYQEKCLRIYDAVDYAENAFNVPIVAYSGEKDAQKKAADNIENALKGFKEPHKFTHLVAPNLEHQMPKEWQDRAQAEYRKFAEKGRDCDPERIRFVTYTPKYGECDWLSVVALENLYERATVDAVRKNSTFTVKTINVRELFLKVNSKVDSKVVIDDQEVLVSKDKDDGRWLVPFLAKRAGKWLLVGGRGDVEPLMKRSLGGSVTGPIDDAFTGYFWVVNPTKPGWHDRTDKHVSASLDQFAAVWDRYFRGKLPMGQEVPRRVIYGNFPMHPNLVLFGDPQSNPLIAKVLPKLPITWTKEKLVVNGVEYDPKTHVPVLIYPNPLNPGKYVVLNSGHTFKEADLKGTNALLYPRLGDWAVIRPTPTENDPAVYEVVAAGLFDENWQFPKKKK